MKFQYAISVKLAPLQFTVDQTILSGDVDIFSDIDQDLHLIVLAHKLDKHEHRDGLAKKLSRLPLRAAKKLRRTTPGKKFLISKLCASASLR